MATILLLVIYLAFISLGLPDSVLGTAWPIMHADLGCSISMAGVVNVVISLSTVVSSLLSQRMIRRMGTWGTTVFSIVLTFLALYLFSACRSIWPMIIFAIPLGLGAGAIDTALNNYVANHYNAMQMNFLHAFWGVGTIIAPAMLSVFFSTGHSWREGYVVLATIQAIICIIVFLSRPLWKKGDGRSRKEEMMEDEKKIYTPLQLLKVPGALFSCLGFTFYTFEGVTILWIASYLVYGKGLDASTAASLSSMVYLGITCGRIASAFIADRVDAKKLILISQLLIMACIVLLLFSTSVSLMYIVIFALGFSFGPIYPAMVRQTVSCFHPRYSVGIISLQMSFNYVGNMITPPLYGLLAGLVGQQLFPFYVLVLVILQCTCTCLKNRFCTKGA